MIGATRAGLSIQHEVTVGVVLAYFLWAGALRVPRSGWPAMRGVTDNRIGITSWVRAGA
jgi:hypothetical protein